MFDFNHLLCRIHRRLMIVIINKGAILVAMITVCRVQYIMSIIIVSDMTTKTRWNVFGHIASHVFSMIKEAWDIIIQSIKKYVCFATVRPENRTICMYKSRETERRHWINKKIKEIKCGAKGIHKACRIKELYMKETYENIKEL